ncbi:MAG TPA: hypothetical protein VFR55_05960 [Dehalococcoidia bacterium]|nr:hypothetical protein [Dehalococcoidia bacterium]
MEGFYYAFGDDDVANIAEPPDSVTMGATSKPVAAGGAGTHIIGAALAGDAASTRLVPGD